jgi:glycerate-2-kinase
MNDPRSVLYALSATAVASADPAQRVRLFLPDPPTERTIVIVCGR